MHDKTAPLPLIKDGRINREYSFLLFDKRVLDQAMDLSNPLLERAKFLSIFKSNLDEFTEVRMGSLDNEAVTDPYSREKMTELTASEQSERIFAFYPRLYRAADQTFSFIRDDLKDNGLDITKPEKLREESLKEAESFFRTTLLPRVNPLVLDPKHPFQTLWNKRIYMMLLLERNGKEMFALASLSPGVERLFELRSGKKRLLITTEDLLYSFGELSFPGYTVKEKTLIRITRNADMTLREEDAGEQFGYDFSSYLKKKIDVRSGQAPVRLELTESAPRIKKYLMKSLPVTEDRIFRTNSYFDYKFLFSIGSYFTEAEKARLSWPRSTPYTDPIFRQGSIIKEIEKHDVLLSYPYDSIDPLISLLEEAAEDPTVTDIRITIYRLSLNSRICSALMKARDYGKEVTALTELSARFDEENNLHYSELLKDAGCTVFYGHKNLKVHSKIISIKRFIDGEVKYITHIGTGNYNEQTSLLYTDLNLLTADDAIGRDGDTFFRNLAIIAQEGDYASLLVSPLYLKPGLIGKIREEGNKGRKGLIRAKMNSLTDSDMINELEEASKKGCEIRLCVRGLCCLLPGIKGRSENISIISVVGRFLEHSRIYAFGEGDDAELYIASADMMTRNLEKRVEIACPIKDTEIKRKISFYLESVLSDNVKARMLGPDGIYRRPMSLGKPINCQEEALEKRRRLSEGEKL